VLFDRICRENGIEHLLTAPRSPTTTGKIERFHRTLRAEFEGNQRASKLEARSGQRLQVRARHHTGAVHPEQSDDAETPIPDCESCCRCVRAGWL
jgi:hypothetical protein